jgi:hypothetical protein
LDERFPCQIDLTDLVRRVTKIKARWAFAIDFPHAQVADPATAQIESLVYFCHQDNVRGASVEGHGRSGKGAKNINDNRGALRFLGPS